MTADEALARIHGCLNGEIHWEGVGPRPWWEAFKRMEELKAERDAIFLFLQDVVEDEWGAKPPYRGSFEPMNQWVKRNGY